MACPGVEHISVSNADVSVLFLSRPFFSWPHTALATTKGICQRDPPCALWDEEMLLEERERDRAQEANINHPPPPYNPAPPLVFNFGAINVGAPVGAPRRVSLDWMDDPSTLNLPKKGTNQTHLLGFQPSFAADTRSLQT